MALNKDNIPREILEFIVGFLGDVVPLWHVSKYLRFAVSGKLKVDLLWSKKDYCGIVAEKGYLKLLQWALENGCARNNDICAKSAKGGHLEVLKWARNNGCDWDSKVTYYARVYNHLEILQWAIENGCPQ